MFFYWLSWLFWIIITFFFPNIQLRNRLAALTLIVISLSQSTFIIFGLELYMSYVLLTITYLLILLKQKESLELLAVIFFLAISYTGLKFILIVRPIWLFIPDAMILTTIYTLVAFLVTNSVVKRYLIASFPLLLGEFFYVIFVSQLAWSMRLGDIRFIHLILIQIAFLFMFQQWKQGKYKYKKLLEKLEEQTN
ncbi:hypothetical protein J2T56_000375 [Natronobacillus azotifigens]|uniref:Uncharacterized protein n=1 Tax=Natronobacillus azotifigens TaxID=472978 RepID=A0A9J6R869_9BACI|nr:hypothetical protein [Natronobacillus azotifigens]MCZ0701850.1 hypothetical protein [Natronobacillus azotifigens]